MQTISPEQIDELLPQTQCGLCGYGGCMPYAEALAFENANINLCPPGGVKTLRALGQLLNQDPEPFISEIEQKSKPPLLAVIREAECIGCMKCIQACPVDAIIGSAKQMHTIITDQCTGCELCVPPCPVDCIDIVPNQQTISDDEMKILANQSRQRFQARQKRLAVELAEKKKRQSSHSHATKQSYIQAAIERVKSKKTVNR